MSAQLRGVPRAQVFRNRTESELRRGVGDAIQAGYPPGEARIYVFG